MPEPDLIQTTPGARCEAPECPNEAVWLVPVVNKRLCRTHLPNDDSAAFRIVPEEEQAHECPGANGDSAAVHAANARSLLESAEAGEATAAENRKRAEHYATQAVLAAALRWADRWTASTPESDALLDAVNVYRRAVGT